MLHLVVTPPDSLTSRRSRAETAGTEKDLGGRAVPESADLEFELVWDAIQDLFNVSLRFTSTKNVDQHAHSTFDIDKNVLDGLVNKDDEYAAALTDMVFGSAESKDGPAEAQRFYSLAVAAAQFAPVHFRLEIDGPTRFHDVRWELLRDPINREHPVATSQHHGLTNRFLGL